MSAEEITRLRAWGARWKRAAGLLKMRADLFARLATKGHDTREAAQAECDRANAPLKGLTLGPRRCGNCGETGHTAAAKRCPSRPDVVHARILAALTEPLTLSNIRTLLGPSVKPRAIEQALLTLGARMQVQRSGDTWRRLAVRS